MLNLAIANYTSVLSTLPTALYAVILSMFARTELLHCTLFRSTSSVRAVESATH